MTTQPDHLEPAYQAALAECSRLVEGGKLQGRKETQWQIKLAANN